MPTTVPIAAPTASPTLSPVPTESPRPAAAAPTRPACAIGAGFERVVREVGRDVVGECVEDERANPANGDVEQRTSRGLLVWHRAENVATFTNGATTYADCPGGIQRRSSAEPFGCGAVAASPVASPVAAPPFRPPASPSPVAAPAACPDAVLWSRARAQVGRQATVFGPVAQTNHVLSSRGQPTFVDLGVAFPNPNRFTIVIWGEHRIRFPSPPEQLYAGKTVCVSGLVELFQNVLQIQVSAPSSITIVGGS